MSRLTVTDLIERSIAAREEMQVVIDRTVSTDSEEPSRRPPLRQRASWMPMVDVAESEQGFLVTVELPGVDEADVHVEVDGNLLTLRGIKREPREPRGANPFFRERAFGRFDRTIVLPARILEDRVTLSLRDGVLSLGLSKED